MKQIRTIQNTNPAVFDDEVNKALQEGWTLTRRYYNHSNFIAELEVEVISEEEKCCENCKHENKEPNMDPCRYCNDADKWESVE